MSEEDKYKVFEPFFTTKAKGTGLGLPVCYSVIKAHGGELIFESQLNKGSTATVLLPLTKGKV
jgi:signal transduction histidine kinase